MVESLKGFIADFNKKADQRPDQLFAQFNGEAITFARLKKQSTTFAAELRLRGVQPGDRVAVMMRNSRLSLPVLFGIARAGAVWVPVNAQQKGEGLRYILDHSKPRMVVCDREFHPTIVDCGAEISSDALITIGEPYDEHSLETILQKKLGFADARLEADDLFAIMYTSGTTGRPKGVLVTHGMLRLAGEAVRILTAMKPGDVFFVWEPLFHIGGAQLITLPIIEDVTLAMIDRFSASAFWSQVRSAGATHIHYLGGILQLLLKQPESHLDRQHSVRIAWGGGCPRDVWPKFRDRFGVEIRECKALVVGALRTADRGISDTEGNLSFHGDITDSIRCKGEDVSAWRLEQVVANHPALNDCAMIGGVAKRHPDDWCMFIDSGEVARLILAQLGAAFAGWQAERINCRDRRAECDEL
ncbi:acyl-coenzyme A synthetase/AMP-(fatty) acid ligase [Bradyrhizobium niftali]